MIRYAIIIVFLFISCSSEHRSKEDIIRHVETVCLSELNFHRNDSLLAPDYIELYVSGFDTEGQKTIEDIVFKNVEIKDRSFFDLWSVQHLSDHRLLLTVNTNYFESRLLSKDSIENLLSKQVGIVTSTKGTLLLKKCNM